MTNEALHRVDARWARAHTHITTFDRELEHMRNPSSEYLSRETQLDGAEHIYKIKAPDKLSNRLSTIASDCLHNLLATLD